MVIIIIRTILRGFLAGISQGTLCDGGDDRVVGVGGLFVVAVVVAVGGGGSRGGRGVGGELGDKEQQQHT